MNRTLVDTSASSAHLRGHPGVSVLSLDEETSHRYAVIHQGLRRRGQPVSPNDLWIAATAFQHGLRLLTTDRDSKQIPQIPQILVHYIEA